MMSYYFCISGFRRNKGAIALRSANSSVGGVTLAMDVVPTRGVTPTQSRKGASLDCEKSESYPFLVLYFFFISIY